MSQVPLKGDKGDVVLAIHLKIGIISGLWKKFNISLYAYLCKSFKVFADYYKH